VKCSYWCDAYELRNDHKIIARYTGGALDEMPAIVECKIGKGRVIVMGTKPDDSWLFNFIKKIMNMESYTSAAGVFVIERVDMENKPAGIIAVNTNQWKAKYAYNGKTHLLESYGVDIFSSQQNNLTNPQK
jgi:hypothetical protein